MLFADFNDLPLYVCYRANSDRIKSITGHSTFKLGTVRTQLEQIARRIMSNRGPISSLTLMVCTYRRPETFPKFIESVCRVRVPEGIRFHVAVADNNSSSQLEAYIGEALAKLPFPYFYGHEPEPGYSNARNMALILAADSETDLLAFSDDDMVLDEGWLEGHLRSHAEFDCDVVGGAIHGRDGKHEHGRRFAHGEQCNVQGAGNVSFRRWLVSADGLALTFNQIFNKTGREDQDFFSQAHTQGAKIVFSAYPVVHDPSMEGDNWLPELMNKSEVSAIMLHNDIVQMRKEKGFLSALLAACWSARFGLKYLVSLCGIAIHKAFGKSRKADLKRVSAHKNGRKFIEAFKALNGEMVSRGDVRRR